MVSLNLEHDNVEVIDTTVEEVRKYLDQPPETKLCEDLEQALDTAQGDLHSGKSQVPRFIVIKVSP